MRFDGVSNGYWTGRSSVVPCWPFTTVRIRFYSYSCCRALMRDRRMRGADMACSTYTNIHGSSTCTCAQQATSFSCRLRLCHCYCSTMRHRRRRLQLLPHPSLQHAPPCTPSCGSASPAPDTALSCVQEAAAELITCTEATVIQLYTPTLLALHDR